MNQQSENNQNAIPEKVELTDQQMDLLNRMDEFNKHIEVNHDLECDEILQIRVGYQTFQQMENLELSMQIQQIDQEVENENVNG